MPSRRREGWSDRTDVRNTGTSPLSILINVLGHEFCFFRYENCHPSFIFVCIFLVPFFVYPLIFHPEFVTMFYVCFLKYYTFKMWLFSPSASLSPEFIHTSEVINILDFILSILNTISFSSSSFCWISHFSSLSFLCSFFLPINLEALLCFKVLFMATYSSESFKYIYFFKCIYSIKRKYIYSIKRKESFYIIFILYTLKKKHISMNQDYLIALPSLGPNKKEALVLGY